MIERSIFSLVYGEMLINEPVFWVCILKCLEQCKCHSISNNSPVYFSNNNKPNKKRNSKRTENVVKFEIAIGIELCKPVHRDIREKISRLNINHLVSKRNDFILVNSQEKKHRQFLLLPKIPVLLAISNIQ